MIEEMSPLTRRIAAVGLLVFFLLVAVQYVVLPVVTSIADLRGELTGLRTREARLQATIDRPLPAPSNVYAGQAVVSPDRVRATQRLQAALAGDAAIASTTLQLGPPCAVPAPPLICANIAISGPEPAVTHFLNRVEHGAPVIRFQHWQLAPPKSGDTQLQFTGQAIAVWQEPS